MYETYERELHFSVNTRNKNSPSSFGSNVLGIIQYVPGGNLKL